MREGKRIVQATEGVAVTLKVPLRSRFDFDTLTEGQVKTLGRLFKLGEDDLLREATDVADTIAKQMGGIGRLKLMLGAKNFTAGSDNLTFKWPNKERSRGNGVRIVLRPDDTYDMEFYNGPKLVKKYEGIYNDQLVSVFEKQTGWFLSLGGPKSEAKVLPKRKAGLAETDCGCGCGGSGDCGEDAPLSKKLESIAARMERMFAAAGKN
jgi:hypothetical protein